MKEAYILDLTKKIKVHHIFVDVYLEKFAMRDAGWFLWANQAEYLDAHDTPEDDRSKDILEMLKTGPVVETWDSSGFEIEYGRPEEMPTELEHMVSQDITYTDPKIYDSMLELIDEAMTSERARYILMECREIDAPLTYACMLNVLEQDCLEEDKENLTKLEDHGIATADLYLKLRRNLGRCEGVLDIDEIISELNADELEFLLGESHVSVIKHQGMRLGFIPTNGVEPILATTDDVKSVFDSVIEFYGTNPDTGFYILDGTWTDLVIAIEDELKERAA